MRRPGTLLLALPAALVACALAAPAAAGAAAAAGDPPDRSAQTDSKHVLIVTADGDTSRVTVNVRGHRPARHGGRDRFVVDLSDLGDRIDAAIDAAVGAVEHLDGLELTAEEPDRLIVRRGSAEAIVDVSEIMKIVGRALDQALASRDEGRRESRIAARGASRAQLRAELAEMREELEALREELARLRADRDR